MPLPIVELALALALAGVAMVIAARSPFHAFCVFIVTLPFENALAIQGPMKITPSYLALIMLAVVCVVHPRRRTTYGSVSSPLTPYLLAYLFVAALSLGMSIVAPPPQIVSASDLLRWRATDYRGVVQFAFLVFSASAFFVTVFFCSNSVRLRLVVSLFLAVSSLVALYAIFQMVGVWMRLPLVGAYAAGLYEQPASLRPNSTFQEPMLFGHFLLAGLPLLATLHLQRSWLDPADRRFYGWPALVVLLLMSVALMLTISRGAWLGALASAAVIVVLSPRRTRNRTMLMILAAGIVGVIAFIVAMGSAATAWYTLANRFSLSASSVGAEQRFWYQMLLFELLQDYPLLGVGFGNYPLYQLAKFDLYGIAGAYGIYWQSLVETGLVGFASLMLMLFMALRVTRRAMIGLDASPWRPYLAGWIASITGLFVAYLFHGDRLSIYVWVVFGLAMATTLVVRGEPGARGPASGPLT